MPAAGRQAPGLFALPMAAANINRLGGGHAPGAEGRYAVHRKLFVGLVVVLFGRSGVGIRFRAA
ncbi:hypothetical protein VM57_13940 [Stenotrophomonas maltophilia]|uniref:Uncharacterized protein n=1 Tax=Stenotrophomonas maltophilia TaxID=40324 RepID=A0A0F5ZMV5_STEMA|nr:hypothetical protein VM57_13940 [Stenotrophomonas maltophilia]